MAAGKKQGDPRLLPKLTTMKIAEFTMIYIILLIVRVVKVRIDIHIHL